MFVLHSENKILNRNVYVVKFDEKGIVFVTERNSRKYADIVSYLMD